MILISEENLGAILETLYLMGIPGMAESIHKAAAEPIKECIVIGDLNW